MIVNIIGGLGNQLFQYAMAIALQNAFPMKEVKINTLCFRGYPLHNGFELNKVFPINLPYATTKDLLKVCYPWIHYRLWQIGRRFLPKRKGMVWDNDLKENFHFNQVANKRYFDGYWQSPKFFEDYRTEIIDAFTFPKLTDKENINALKYISEKNTAFVHIRRGDYLHHPVYGGICTSNYYNRAISILKGMGYHRYIVFSNDIPWCKEYMSEAFANCEVIFATWNKGQYSYRDMQLMSYCKAGIIANSSFSWWGAWLGKMNIVLCPDKWTNISGHRDDIYPKQWLRINTK